MVATSSHLLWYATRATGVVALVLLTASVVLGVLTSVRFGTESWPRFALQDLHKRISLLSMLFVGLHVLTTVSDSYAPIGWVSVFVPFTSSYRRLWLGLGTAAVDLLLAVSISSLLRQRINPRTWRALHWLTYASWPLALFHGFGTGTDPHLEWMVALTVACVSAVVAAISWRLVAGWPKQAGARLAAGTTSVAAVIAFAAWTATGPLRPGWAARAGTPPSLLAGSHRAAASPPSAPTQSPSLPTPPYDAPLVGNITQTAISGGNVQLDIKTQTQGSLQATLEILIVGSPDTSGGVVMQQSRASFGPTGSTTEFQGRVVALEGSRILLVMSNQSGLSIELRIDLLISNNQVTGQLRSVTAGTR